MKKQTVYIVQTEGEDCDGIVDDPFVFDSEDKADSFFIKTVNEKLEAEGIKERAKTFEEADTLAREELDGTGFYIRMFITTID